MIHFTPRVKRRALRLLLAVIVLISLAEIAGIWLMALDASTITR